MDSLNEHIREYTTQLGNGHIQKAYKGIMTSMSDLRVYLEGKYPCFTAGALYFGYMDMTYFAFTPPELKDKKLKIARSRRIMLNCWAIRIQVGIHFHRFRYQNQGIGSCIMDRI